MAGTSETAKATLIVVGNTLPPEGRCVTRKVELARAGKRDEMGSLRQGRKRH